MSVYSENREQQDRDQDRNGCNNDHTDCEAVVVTKPVCDENTGSKEICDVVDGQATMMICQSDGQDGYAWVAKQDGACGTNVSCKADYSACEEENNTVDGGDNNESN